MIPLVFMYWKNTACTCNNLCQINANNNYCNQPNYFQSHISGIISRNICLQLFPGIYISVWNYFQHACQCLELFPDIYVSVWNYFLSRHTWQCLEIFPDIYVSVWNYFQHTCLCLELFPDIYLSVWYYFQTYVAAVSGNISRQICQCLELFPDKYVSAWNYFQTYMTVSGNISRQICLEIYRNLLEICRASCLEILDLSGKCQGNVREFYWGILLRNPDLAREENHHLGQYQMDLYSTRWIQFG